MNAGKPNKKWWIGALAAIVIGIGALSASFGESSKDSLVPTSPSATTSERPQVEAAKVETKTEIKTEAVPYSSSIVSDDSLVQGTTLLRTSGQNGVRTLTYEVTYTDGNETARQEISNVITEQPINQVIVKGTKVQSNCPNGTYINTYGNVVCSPYQSSGAPAGATAKCGDGTYSFSQSRSGACSHHGGVATWL